MHTNTSLESLLNDHEILNINPQKILAFARIKNIGQLIQLSLGNEVEGLYSNKILNDDTIKLAKYILKQIGEILNLDPLDIKEKDIYPITLKLGEELTKTKNIESYIIGTFIKSIANQVKVIHLRYERLSKHKQNVELKIDSSIDVITGLLNRKTIDLYLEDAISDKNRNGTNYYAVLIDIDHFKKINDTYGHTTGDVVLKEISKIFKNNFREIDKIGRWGGDEFLIILKGGDYNSYITKLEELRLFVEKNLVNNVNNKLKEEGCECSDHENYIEGECNCENCINQDKITISIGFTNIIQNDFSKNITERADRGLYNVKKLGRNGVEFIE